MVRWKCEGAYMDALQLKPLILFSLLPVWVLVKAVSMSGLAEEAGFAYKNISDVVETVQNAGITRKVAELRPIGNIKG